MIILTAVIMRRTPTTIGIGHPGDFWIYKKVIRNDFIILPGHPPSKGGFITFLVIPDPDPGSMIYSTTTIPELAEDNKTMFAYPCNH